MSGPNCNVSSGDRRAAGVANRACERDLLRVQPRTECTRQEKCPCVGREAKPGSRESCSERCPHNASFQLRAPGPDPKVGGANDVPQSLRKKPIKVLGEYTIHNKAANRIYKKLHVCALLRSFESITATLRMRDRLRDFEKGLPSMRKAA